MYTREVFPTKAFKDKAAEFVLVRIDVDTDADVARKFDVSGIPDIQFLTPEGKVVHRVSGYLGTDGLLNEMAKAKLKTYPPQLEVFEGEPTRDEPTRR